MNIRIYTISPKKVKTLLVGGNCTFNEQTQNFKNEDFTADDFRSMIKNRKPQMHGKSLQSL